MNAALTAEVDRLMPGWTVDLDGGKVTLGPMTCPRCGVVVVLIEWPPQAWPRRLNWWREITAAGLAGRFGPDGDGLAGDLPQHAALRCRAIHAAGLVDLDAQAAA